jgi:hypothetical protein
MIKFIDSADDVIACTVAHGFTSIELADLIDRLEHSLDLHSKTHMFLEIPGLDGVDWRAVVEQTPRGLKLIRRLERLGRIAVVSNDPWVRLWTRAESAMLPHVSYELFRDAERQRALEWVLGHVDRPHEPALTFLPTKDPSLIAFEIDGEVTAADMDTAVERLQPMLESTSGPIRVLARVGDLSFPSVSALVKERYIDLKADTLARVDRYAVVGGPEWLRAVIKSLAPLLHFEIRHFTPSQEAAAWEWIDAAAGTEAPTDAKVRAAALT